MRYTYAANRTMETWYTFPAEIKLDSALKRLDSVFVLIVDGPEFKLGARGSSNDRRVRLYLNKRLIVLGAMHFPRNFRAGSSFEPNRLTAAMENANSYYAEIVDVTVKVCLFCLRQIIKNYFF